MTIAFSPIHSLSANGASPASLSPRRVASRGHNLLPCKVIKMWTYTPFADNE